MKILTVCALSGALLALSACDRRDDATVGQKMDRSVATAENAGKDVKREAQQKGSEMAQAVSDSTITAAVKTDLAKDSELSALRINVDTQDGRVTLKGSAPNEQAKQRAEQLAMAERGVKAVDNNLMIDKK